MKRKKQNSCGLAMRLAGGAVGGALGQVLKNTVMKSMNPTISNIILFAAGAVLPEVANVKGMDELGAGLIGVGAAGVAGTYIPGLGATPEAVRMSKFNSAIGENEMSNFYERIIAPASNQAIAGRVRAPKKKIMSGTVQ